MAKYKQGQTLRRGTVEVTHKGKKKGKPKMLTVEEYGNGVEEYFELCKKEDRPPTLPGLSFHLGFAARQSVHDYAKDPEYAYAAGRALLGVEAWLAEKVVQKEFFTPGQIFTLKSMFGYEDKQSIDHQSSDGSLSPKSVDSDIVKSLVDKLTD